MRSPGEDEADIEPPCRRMIWRQRLSPTPEPSFFVVKKGMNIFSRLHSGMPRPLSATSMTGLPPASTRASISIAGLGVPSKASKEFLTRLIRAKRSFFASVNPPERAVSFLGCFAYEQRMQ